MLVWVLAQIKDLSLQSFDMQVQSSLIVSVHQFYDLNKIK